MQIDINGDGAVELEELKKFIPPEHHDDATEAFKRADRNKDGKLDRAELRHLVRAFKNYLNDCENSTLKSITLYIHQWQRRAYWFAKVIVEPKNVRGDSVDGAYADEYTCCPPPIFMLSITLIMVRLVKFIKILRIG